tara:strand:- start:7048 stop:7281 length:234 start_codon:yes stop_codon:yes gene_type:complete
MQKIINGVALLSGLVSLSVLGGGAYLYVQKDTLIEGAREKATAAITEAITDALPAMIDSAMPEIPSVPSTTGAALPF